MACGAPVLTTPRLSLPEVGGDAVAYTEPEAAAISTKLADLLSDDVTAGGLTSVARGLARAHEFTWRPAPRPISRVTPARSGSDSVA